MQNKAVRCLHHVKIWNLYYTQPQDENCFLFISLIIKIANQGFLKYLQFFFIQYQKTLTSLMTGEALLPNKGKMLRDSTRISSLWVLERGREGGQRSMKRSLNTLGNCEVSLLRNKGNNTQNWEGSKKCNTIFNPIRI